MALYSGTFTLEQQLQASAAGTWILPPGAPTIGTATATGETTATVAFTPPTNAGSSPITSYTATSSPSGITGTGASSPITVSGLAPATTYTFTVTATSAVGTSPASAASNSITTVAPFLTTYPILTRNPATYYSVPPQAFTLGTSAFTVEFFLWQDTNTNSYDQWIGQWGTNSTFQFSNLTGNGTGIGIQRASSAVSGPSMSNILTSQWNFIAYTFDGSNYRVYINGTGYSMTGSVAEISPNTSQNVGVGRVIDQTGFGVTGRMGYLRVTKNVARYTAGSMSVPTGPYPTGGSDPNWSNVSLLMPMAGSAVDLSNNNYSITPVNITYGP